MKYKGDKATARFIHEAGQLKKRPRSGWLTIGIKSPESIADHCWRAAAIGYLLARMEGADAARVVELCIFHDMHEARTGDLDTVAKKYSKTNPAAALRDQARGVHFGKEIIALAGEFSAQKTKEAKIAKDADLLEMIAQARDYIDSGNAYAKEWIPEARKSLRTRSARRLAAAIARTSSNEFWLSL